MGGSLAIRGAAALADALEASSGDFDAAFRRYNDSFHPYIEEVQARALVVAKETFLPRTRDAIPRKKRQF